METATLSGRILPLPPIVGAGSFHEPLREPPSVAARGPIWSAPAERSDDGALAWERGKFWRRGLFPAASQSGGDAALCPRTPHDRRPNPRASQFHALMATTQPT